MGGSSFTPDPTKILKIESLNDYLSIYGPGKKVRFQVGDRELFLREVGDIESDDIVFELTEF